METRMAFLYLLVLLIGASLQETEKEKDLVTDLPGYPEGITGTYSGYLDIIDTSKHFHYVFQESETEKDKKPLVLWLNGGPGCSSLLGWLKENGPARYDGKAFVVNDFSWHKAANMLYLESPGRVGFSTILVDSEAKWDDLSTARDNFNALKAFYEKFPEFKDRDLYLSGESYAGIYIPTLANEILKYNTEKNRPFHINLNAIMIGNGVTDWTVDTLPAYPDFLFAHSLISYEMKLEYNQYCVKQPNTQKCEALVEKGTKLTDGLNVYDILQDCHTTPRNGDSSNFYYQYARWAFPDNSQSKAPEAFDFINEEPTAPCLDHSAVEQYLNQQSVKKALHVNEDIKWNSCTIEVGGKYLKDPRGSIYLYPRLIASGTRILIFSGDTDMVVPFNGNLKWITNLHLRIKQPWRSWRAYKGKDKDMDNIAGYVTVYDGLTFVTVKGTGHMVPEWKPSEAYYMFEKFLKEEDL